MITRFLGGTFCSNSVLGGTKTFYRTGGKGDIAEVGFQLEWLDHFHFHLNYEKMKGEDRSSHHFESHLLETDGGEDVMEGFLKSLFLERWRSR